MRDLVEDLETFNFANKSEPSFAVLKNANFDPLVADQYNNFLQDITISSIGRNQNHDDSNVNEHIEHDI